MYRSLRLFSIAVLAVTISSAVAQSFPTKPIRLVVPYPPGGGTDITARLVAVPAAAALGQPIVIDNRPGASGMVGTDIVADAAPDGHTLLVFADINTIAPALYPKLNHDPLTDFTPVALLGIGTLVIFANPSAPVTTLSEMFDYARRHPNGLSYASPGNGRGDGPCRCHPVPCCD